MNFRLTVNPVSKLDQYPIPRVEDLFAMLDKGDTFTKLDLSQAYQQLALDRESQKYVVISTYEGLFLCRHLPYGVSSAPGIFQGAMETILRSSENLERVGLCAKRHQCIFMAPSVSYLVYVIDAQGLHPQPDKIEAIEDAPKPKNVTELKSYLGLYCHILGNSYPTEHNPLLHCTSC